MKIFTILFLVTLSARADIPNVKFSGAVRGDYTANHCRINNVEIQISPAAEGSLSLTWLEKGRLVQFNSPCDIDYSANLTVSQRSESENPIEWLLRFSSVPNYGNAFLTKTEDTYRVRAETENFAEGIRYRLQLDLLYNSDQNTVSYSRSMLYSSGITQTVFGPLTIQH